MCGSSSERCALNSNNSGFSLGTECRIKIVSPGVQSDYSARLRDAFEPKTVARYRE
jgi:hypothetical protein